MAKLYRIIRESDGNGVRHYEIEFREKRLFGGYKWVPVKTRAYPRQFKDYVECLTYLKSLNVQREIVDQDEV
jgi:hypothetical protein